MSLHEFKITVGFLIKIYIIIIIYDKAFYTSFPNYTAPDLIVITEQTSFLFKRKFTSCLVVVLYYLNYHKNK